MEGLDLASRATVEAAHVEGEGPLVVAFDYGMKRNIVRMLVDHGMRVTVVPAETTADQVRALKPEGALPLEWSRRSGRSDLRARHDPGTGPGRACRPSASASGTS